MAIDYPRAMAAYKVGAERGDAPCQNQVGFMYREGHGVAVDYRQARLWLEKGAAQDEPEAVGALGLMYMNGKGVTPSWRRARELYQRAIELGNSEGVEAMQYLTEGIQNVSYTSRLFHHLPYRESSLISLAPVPPSHAQLAPLMDKRVEIHGTSRADMNGKRGVATDFHPMDLDDVGKWRYTMQLDSGEAFKLKLANVRAEGTGGGVGADQAKGTGKKGRGDRK